ncbi:Meckelin [Chytriomyces sp. MP71]|nr:Meckelin [Chytriomyces sp. MP71]
MGWLDSWRTPFIVQILMRYALMASSQSVSSISLPPFVSNAASSFNSCGVGAAWDIAELYCRPCSLNQTVVTSSSYAGVPGSQQCTCKKGYYLSGGTSTLDTASTCLKCPGNQVSSFDQSFCLSCPNNVIVANGQVTCPCGLYQYLVDRDSNNYPLSVAICKTCPSGTYPSSDLATCISCPQAGMIVANATAGQYTCTCNTTLQYQQQPIGGICVNATTKVPTISSTTITYSSAVGPSGLQASITNFASDYFAEYLPSAATYCKNNWDEVSCQILGNMCVLQFYDTTSIACSLYQQILATRPSSKQSELFQRPVGMPWLYYTETIPSQISQLVPNLTINFSNPPQTGALRFIMATYSPTGQFLGFQYLKNQFAFCTNSDVSSTPWLIVGHNYDVKCNINIANVANSTIETTFYEIFLIDDDGNYIPVPVRILNLQANQLGYEYYYAGNVFARRFFLIDTISGVSNGVLQVLRVPTQISFRVMMTSNNDGSIYLPIMDIMYAERTVDGSINPSDTSIYASPPFQFTMKYGMTLDSFWNSMQIFFSVTTAGLLAAAIYRTLKWSKRNTVPGESIDIQIIAQSVVNICACVGATYFWFMTAICSYWFFFYKGQTTLYLLVPTAAHDIYIFTCVLATATIPQVIYVSVKVYHQCKASMFFFDWEKTRGKLTHTHSLHGKEPVEAPVSVWRSIFMANQWHSIQVIRKVSIEFQLISMYFILDGLSVQYAATPQPNIHDLSPGARNPVLIFALDALIWMGLAGMQLAYRFLIYDRFYRDRLLQYADLLSVANISMIVFDEKRHGYYIHGRSVHHSSDTHFADLNECLRKEEHDMVPSRGLDHTDQQVFEIFVTPELRSMYDKIYGIVAASDPFSQLMARNFRLSAVARNVTSKIKGADEQSVAAHNTVSKFLCNFIEKKFKEYQYTTREKTFVEKIVGATPDVFHGSVFLNDPHGCAQVMLRGIEPALLICHALIFICVDIQFNSVAAASLVVYLLDSLMLFVRSHFGERNLSMKTLLDWKFLV